MIGEAGQAPRQVMPLDSNLQYVDSGQVIFAREGVLLGQTFDSKSARPIGEPFSIANPVRYFHQTGLAQFSASRNGALAYVAHGYVARTARVDRTGRELDTLGTSGENGRLHLAHDQQTALFDRSRPGNGTIDVWSIDLTRGVEARLTTDPGTEAGGVMIPGAHAMIFASTNRGGPPNLVRKDLDTGAEDYLLPFSASLQMAEDITADGRILLYAQRVKGGQYDLRTLSLSGSATPTTYIASQADETSARIAPDGRFVAYSSNDSGRREIQVASFPSRGASTRVSIAGEGFRDGVPTVASSSSSPPMDNSSLCPSVRRPRWRSAGRRRSSVWAILCGGSGLTCCGMAISWR
jgi:serine/threonine-protein kinase